MRESRLYRLSKLHTTKREVFLDFCFLTVQLIESELFLNGNFEKQPFLALLELTVSIRQTSI